MLRTQVVASVFFLSLSLACGIFSTFSPTWLVTRVELKERACSTGQGIFIGESQWGDSIPSIGLSCGQGGKYTDDLYCSESGAAFERNMCASTRLAKLLSICAISATVCAFLIAVALSIGYLKSRALLACLAGTVLSATACGLYISVFVVMFGSRLFSKAHFGDISKGNDRPFESWGCVFQTPLHTPFKRLLRDSPLNCLLGGSGFAASLAAITSAILATVAFAMLCRNYSKTYLAPAKPRTSSTGSLLSDAETPR